MERSSKKILARHETLNKGDVTRVVGHFAIRSTEVCHLALIKEWMPAFAGMTQTETGPLPSRAGGLLKAGSRSRVTGFCSRGARSRIWRLRDCRTRIYRCNTSGPPARCSCKPDERIYWSSERSFHGVRHRRLYCSVWIRFPVGCDKIRSNSARSASDKR